MIVRPADFLGYHTKETFGSPPALWNGMKVAGIFPGPSGIIAGIFHLFVAYNIRKDTNKTKGAKALLVCRAIAEILGAGIIFFIVDLIVSINRHCSCSCLKTGKGAYNEY